MTAGMELSHLRRRLLALLSDRPSTQSWLAAAMKIGRTTARYNLEQMRTAGLVVKRNTGKEKLYYISEQGWVTLRASLKYDLTGGNGEAVDAFDRSGPDRSRGQHAPPPQPAQPAPARALRLSDRQHDVVVRVPYRHLDVAAALRLGFRRAMPGMKGRGVHLCGYKVKGAAVQVTDRSFLFYLDPLTARSPDLAMREAWHRVGDALEKLAGALPGIRFGDGEVLGEIVRQSHASPGDPLAVEVRRRRVSVRHPRFEIDSSQGPELEFVHKTLAQDDFRAWQSAMEGVDVGNVEELVLETVEGRFRPREVSDRLALLEENQALLVENQGHLRRLVERNGRDNACHEARDDVKVVLQGVGVLAQATAALLKAVEGAAQEQPARQQEDEPQPGMYG